MKPVENPALDKRDKMRHTAYSVLALITGLFAFTCAFLFLWAFEDMKEDPSSIGLMVAFFGTSIVLCILFGMRAARISATMPEEKEIPTDEREIDGYRIYQNLTDEEKREIRYGVKESVHALTLAAVFLLIGYGVLLILGIVCMRMPYGYIVCWGGSAACLIAAMILGVVIWVRRERWLKRNKIITTRYQYDRLIRKKQTSGEKV